MIACKAHWQGKAEKQLRGQNTVTSEIKTEITRRKKVKRPAEQNQEDRSSNIGTTCTMRSIAQYYKVHVLSKVCVAEFRVAFPLHCTDTSGTVDFLAAQKISFYS